MCNKKLNYWMNLMFNEIKMLFYLGLMLFKKQRFDPIF